MCLPRLSCPARILLTGLVVGLIGYFTLGRFLLTYGMFNAAERGDVVTLRLLMLLGGNMDFHHRDVRGGGTVLVLAAQRNQLHAVTFLLQRGANPDIQDNSHYSPLIYATMYGNRELFDTLMRYHANPNLTERCGLTAYDWALQKHYAELARKLRQAGGRSGTGGGCG